jgi:Uma2 family endonuclease
MGAVPDFEDRAMAPTALTQKLLTAEEFSCLPDPPDGSQQELVRGVVMTMARPRGPHGFCCAAISGEIYAYLKQHKIGQVFSNDTGVVTETNPDTVRGPDIFYFSFERMPAIPEADYFRIGPDLAVEVLSPTNRRAGILEKIREYLTVGTRLVWVLSPEDKSVTVHRIAEEGKALYAGAILLGEEVLPGFSVPVADLFPTTSPA